jgi:hypothetical protein
VRLEDQLREQQTYLRGLIDSSGDGLARISHTIFARSIGSADDFLSWQELAWRRGVGRRVARVEVFGAAGAA